MRRHQTPQFFPPWLDHGHGLRPVNPAKEHLFTDFGHTNAAMALLTDEYLYIFVLNVESADNSQP